MFAIKTPAPPDCGQRGQALPAVMVILLLLSLMAAGLTMGVSSALSSQRVSKQMVTGDLQVQSAIETAAAGVAAGQCGSAPAPVTSSPLSQVRVPSASPRPSPSPTAAPPPMPTPTPTQRATATPPPSLPAQVFPTPYHATAPPAPSGAPRMLGFSCARIDFVDLAGVRQQIETRLATSGCAVFPSPLTVTPGTVLIWFQTMLPLWNPTAWLTSNTCSQTAAPCATATSRTGPVTQIRLRCSWTGPGNPMLALATSSSLSVPLTTVVRWAPESPGGGNSVAMVAVPTDQSPHYEQADLAMTGSGTRLLFEGELR